MPPPSAAVPPCQLPFTGRNRSIREVNRCTSPSDPSSISLRTRQQVTVPPTVLVRA